MVAQTFAHVFHRLLENARDLAQAGQVVLVVFHVTERRIRSQRSAGQVNAVELRRRHLPVFELRALNRFPQAPHHKRAVEFLRLRKPSDIDGFEALERLTGVLEVLGDRLVRKIAQPIVISIIPYLGGKFRLRAERVFPLLGEQMIQFRAPAFQALPGGLAKARFQRHRATDNH